MFCSVRTVPGHTWDLCHRESSVELRLAVPGVVGEAQEVGPSEAPPLMAGEALEIVHTGMENLEPSII